MLADVEIRQEMDQVISETDAICLELNHIKRILERRLSEQSQQRTNTSADGHNGRCLSCWAATSTPNRPPATYQYLGVRIYYSMHAHAFSLQYIFF